MKAKISIVSRSRLLLTSWYLISLTVMVSRPGSTQAFVSSLDQRPARTCSPYELFAVYGNNDDVERELQRARVILQKSKAKLAAKAESSEPAVPFFAHAGKTAVSRDGVVKTKNEETGLVTADGERMAAISEEEDWEARSLSEVFQSEISEDQDVYSTASQQLAERDVVASIWGLRQRLQTEDYQRIFDKRNRFIGEDT